jgi:hypothetical protein
MTRKGVGLLLGALAFSTSASSLAAPEHGAVESAFDRAGRVRGGDEAETAVRLAVQTNGVQRVVSRLAWAGMAPPPAQ